MASSVRIPRIYHLYAQSLIDSLWVRPLDNGKLPMFTKDQIAARIEAAVANRVEIDGPLTSAWIPCEHCDGSGEFYQAPTGGTFSTGTSEVRGLCYQCYGKGQQSPADQKRNWGYQKRAQEALYS